VGIGYWNFWVLSLQPIREAKWVDFCRTKHLQYHLLFESSPRKKLLQLKKYFFLSVDLSCWCLGSSIPVIY
jgi:hypothetical protein